jgi:hypothetical protein
MFDFIQEDTSEVLARLELVGIGPFDHADVASFQLTREGAALGPLGLLGTDRISGPFSSSVNRLTADGGGGLMSDTPLQQSTLTYEVNDPCRHELHVSAGPMGMSDSLGMDPTLCLSPSISVFGIWRVAPEPMLGDVNRDGEVNGRDIDPFVEVLLSGPYQPEADMNEDGDVNGLDVDPFVAAVVGGTQQIPEPSTLFLALVALGVVGGWRTWKRAA